jgi:hypothetical protein
MQLWQFGEVVFFVSLIAVPLIVLEIGLRRVPTQRQAPRAPGLASAERRPGTKG